jgi:hypothetical protein
MTMRMFPALVLAIALSADPRGPDPARAEAEARVRDAAEKIRNAIVAEDVEAIAARISPDGVSCGAEIESRAAVQRELRSRSGNVHAQLFDTERYREVLEGWGDGSPEAVCFREFFQKAKTVLVDVSWDERSSGSRGWVTWGSPSRGDPTYWPSVQFALDRDGNLTIRAFGTCAFRDAQRTRPAAPRPNGYRPATPERR